MIAVEARSITPRPARKAPFQLQSPGRWVAVVLPPRPGLMMMPYSPGPVRAYCAAPGQEKGGCRPKPTINIGGSWGGGGRRKRGTTDRILSGEGDGTVGSSDVLDLYPL